MTDNVLSYHVTFTQTFQEIDHDRQLSFTSHHVTFT
jgi:hypothetical protein